VHVRSSFDDSDGTWVVPEDDRMEQVVVSGVSLDRDQAKITVRRVPDRPGVAYSILGPIADANIVVDMIIQNASAAGDTDLTFTVPKTDFRRALAMVEQTAQSIGAEEVTSDTEVSKVSVVGLGMRSHAGVAARMFETLAREGINIQMISTSEIKISVVIGAKYGELAVRALHAALVEADGPTEGAAPPAPGKSARGAHRGH
jgi:aspartate kinase